MTIYVYPSDRLSTRVLKLLAAAPGPMTVDQMAAALNVADGPERKRLTAIVMNFRNRDRIVQRGRLAGVSGRPGLWTITDAAREAVARGKGRPRPKGAGRPRRGPRGKPKRPDPFALIAGSFPVGNTLWQRAAAVVPRASPDREDLISDLVVAQLEGETDLKAALKRARAARNRALNPHAVVSLDRLMPGTDNLRLIDTLTTEHERA